MIPRRAFRSVVVVVFGTTMILRSVNAATSNDEALYRRAKTLYSANRLASRAIECTFFVDLNGLQRECRYARDGDRVYLSGVYLTPGGGLSMPDEIAWDGQRVYHRARFKSFSRGSDHNRLKLSCPPPEDAVSLIVENLLDITPNPARRGQLTGAHESFHDGHPYVELEFAAGWTGGAFTVRHSCDEGYWPVYALLTNAKGEKAYEMTDVTYARAEVDGNVVYYPVTLTQWDVGSGGPNGSNTVKWTVERRSLMLGKPVARSRFTLEPWPCDVIDDFDLRKQIAPKDVHWSPLGKVGFPWDRFAQSIGDNERRRNAMTSRAGTSAASPIQSPADASRSVPLAERSSLWLYPIGGVLLLSGIIVGIRRGKEAT